MKGPCWIKQWIADLAALNDQFRDEEGKIDFMALGREEYAFRTALITRKFAKSERARDTYMKAKAAYDVKVDNGKKGGRPRKNTAGAPNGNNWDESATACENMRRVPQNEDPSHGFSGGDRPAQGSMSIPPSWAAHDGNNLGSGRPSTEAPTRKNGDEHQTGCKTGVSESATSVDKSNSVCNTGSVQPVTRRESGKSNADVTTKKPRTGGLLPSSSLNPPVRPVGHFVEAAIDVLNLAYSGEFGNVRLTQEQYSQLGIKFGNQQKLNRAIDSLSCQIENGEKNPANHYAELVKWANYRDDMEENEQLKASTAPHYETVSEHNARIVRESDAWIHEYCQQQKKNKKAANG